MPGMDGSSPGWLSEGLTAHRCPIHFLAQNRFITLGSGFSAKLRRGEGSESQVSAPRGLGGGAARQALASQAVAHLGWSLRVARLILIAGNLYRANGVEDDLEARIFQLRSGIAVSEFEFQRAQLIHHGFVDS